MIGRRLIAFRNIQDSSFLVLVVVDVDARGNCGFESVFLSLRDLNLVLGSFKASSFRKLVSEYASERADRFVKTLFHDKQAPNISARRLEKVNKHWNNDAVKRAYDSVTDYNVGSTG